MIYEQDDQKRAFMEMSLPEQLGSIFDMLRYERNEIGTIRKNEIEFRIDLAAFREELREVRREREKREKKLDIDLQTTTEKIMTILGKRFDFWTYLRDKVVPQILTLVIVGLLYLVFSKP